MLYKKNYYLILFPQSFNVLKGTIKKNTVWVKTKKNPYSIL